MIAPRALGWIGTHAFEALWLDRSLLGEDAARRRILSLWRPGVSVRSLAGGYLITLATPQQLDARRAPGLPLLRVQGRLLSVPLSPAEWDALAPPPGAVLLLRGGVIEAHNPDDAPTVQPARWLDLDALVPSVVAPLGDPPPPPEVVEAARSLASQLGILPDDEAAALLAALEQRSSEPAPSGGGWSFAGALSSTLRSWMGAADNLSDSFGGLKSAAKASFGWLDKLASRSGLLSQLEKHINKQGADRIRKLLDKFDQGATDDALKGAIPLRKSGSTFSGGGLGGVLSGLLAGSRPRPGLSLPTGGGGGGKSWNVADELYKMLEEMYHRLHTQLDEAGRFEEAAYVLAELLDEPEEAIAYLISKGDLRRAAELAERRNRPIGEQIALWLRAGDRVRALLLARLKDGFEPAIAELETDDPALARWMRTRWATFLASTGRYTAAVKVAWPLGGTPSSAARGWLDKAIALGGPGGAQAFRMKLERCPDALDELRTQLRPMLGDQSAVGPLVRRMLAAELAEVPAARGLARPLARAVMRDQIDNATRDGGKILSALCAVVDPALGADLPPTQQKPTRPHLSTLTAPVISHTVRGGDTGLHAVYDAAPLPGGGLVAALGREGCHLFDGSGRRVGTLEAPVTSLVVTDDGSRALGLAPRGPWLDIYQLDLAARTAQRCGTLRAHDPKNPAPGLSMAHHARSYDGHTFAVSGPDTLAILSVLPGEPVQVLWQSSVPEGAQVTFGPLDWDKSGIYQLVHGPEAVEWWRHPLPGPLSPQQRTLKASGLTWPPAAHALLAERAASIDGRGLHFRSLQSEETVSLDALAEALGPPPYKMLDGQGAWMVVAAGDTAHLWLASTARPSGRRLHVTLTGASRIQARLSQEHLTVFDDLGRVVAFWLTDGTLVRSVRA